MKLTAERFLARQNWHALLNYSTPTKLLNLARSTLERRLKRNTVSARPSRLIVDVTNACNLRCPNCPTGKQVKGRPRGFMGLERFQSILDQLGRHAYFIDLFNWGEPLLNQDLPRMISLAEKRRICTGIHTNLSLRLSDEQVQGLVYSGLSYLTASLDGADQETYARYRKGGSLETALANARRIVQVRVRSRQRKPYLTWQFLTFPHNSHQVGQARRLAAQTGFDRFVTMSGITDRNRQGTMDRGGICEWLWSTATVHWDGKIGPCCLQFMARDDFGMLAEEEFMVTWNNDKFQYARSLFTGRPRAYRKILCNHCHKVTVSNR